MNTALISPFLILLFILIVPLSIAIFFVNMIFQFLFSSLGSYFQDVSLYVVRLGVVFVGLVVLYLSCSSYLLEQVKAIYLL